MDPPCHRLSGKGGGVCLSVQAHCRSKSASSNGKRLLRELVDDGVSCICALQPHTTKRLACVFHLHTRQRSAANSQGLPSGGWASVVGGWMSEEVWGCVCVYAPSWGLAGTCRTWYHHCPTPALLLLLSPLDARHVRKPRWCQRRHQRNNLQRQRFT